MADVRVLVIDGNADRRARLLSDLSGSGFQVTVADSGRQGVEEAQVGTFDAILLDVALWGSPNSFQVLERLQSIGVLATTAVLMSVPQEGDARIGACLDLGASDYVTEPHEPRVISARIRGILALREVAAQELTVDQREALQKIENDVQIARQIQLGFLPDELPQPEGWQLAARFHPAREVAGDFYDAFFLTQNRRVGFLIADVCDKGVGAALFMSLARSLLRAYARQHYGISGWTKILDGDGDSSALKSLRTTRGGGMPGIGTAALKNAVELTNGYITENHLDMNMFLTLFFGVFDPATGAIVYCNGGHCPPLIVGADGGIRQKLAITGPAVGIFADAEFGIEQAQLEPGETLFCFTDGVTDARDPQRQLFGEQRLEELLTEPAGNAEGLMNRFEIQLQSHIANAVQFDDITMLALHRSAKPSAPQPLP